MISSQLNPALVVRFDSAAVSWAYNASTSYSHHRQRHHRVVCSSDVTVSTSATGGSPVCDDRQDGKAPLGSKQRFIPVKFNRATAPECVLYRTDPGLRWRTPTEPLPRPGANQRAAPGRQGLSVTRAVGRTRDGFGAVQRG